jgi:TP53 regulating kinase-like protein
VFRLTFLQRAAVAKQRFSKRYRHPELDARLTKSRLAGVRPAREAAARACSATRHRLHAPLTWHGGPSQEARSLVKARKLGVAAPVLYHVDAAAACLYMEFVPGALVKERLFAGLDDAGARRQRAQAAPPQQP